MAFEELMLEIIEARDPLANENARTPIIMIIHAKILSYVLTL
jgi:hypothetical protein